MQPWMAKGALISRLASHAAAACSLTTPYCCGILAEAQRRSAASATVSSSDHEDANQHPPISLTPEQRQHLPQLLSLLERPGHTAQRLGALTHLAVTYRDLSVTLSALHMRERGFNPITDDESDYERVEQLQQQQQQLAASITASAAGGGAAAAAAATHEAAGLARVKRGTYLPLKDVTRLPEHVQVDGRSEAPLEPQYQMMHMDKISCWAAMQPSHMEMSQPLLTAVKLFPPQEAAYPTYVDFDAALRKLSQHVSRKRLTLQRRRLRKLDKYQLKTWDHFPGEV